MVHFTWKNNASANELGLLVQLSWRGASPSPCSPCSPCWPQIYVARFWAIMHVCLVCTHVQCVLWMEFYWKVFCTTNEWGQTMGVCNKYSNVYCKNYLELITRHGPQRGWTSTSCGRLWSRLFCPLPISKHIFGRGGGGDVFFLYIYFIFILFFLYKYQ